MVPKTSSSSSSSKAGGAGSATGSASASDLYQKMNDYVLSRTPDQSVTNQYLHHVIRLTVASISQEIGWHTAHLSALDVLSDLTIRYLLQVAKQSKKYTEHFGRTLVNEDDVALGFRDMNISISELEEYVQNFDPVVLPVEVPYIPVPRKTDLNFLRHGSEEMLNRPIHVHEYMPPMIMEQPSEEEMEADRFSREVVLVTDVPMVSEEVQIKSEPDANGILNGESLLPMIVDDVPEVAAEMVVSDIPTDVVEIEVKTENGPEIEMGMMMEEHKNVLHQVSIVQNDLEESSDDDIEPAASKAASIFATFKSTKKLESTSENATLRRRRKYLEEHGHPVREVTSVIMTSSGFISECREGRLPERKPPAFRSFFDPPPPQSKESKKTTMKKILQNVKKSDKSGKSDSEEENAEGPGLFGVMDKIVSAGGNNLGAPNDAMNGAGENGVLVDVKNKDIKKLSKQERKQLSKQKKEAAKELKKRQKKKKDKLISNAKMVQAAAAASKELLDAGPASALNKLKIFKKSSKTDAQGNPIIKKKKKDKKNRLKLKEMQKQMDGHTMQVGLMKAPPAPAGTELIESDEDFSNADGTISPARMRHPSSQSRGPDDLPVPFNISQKKIKKEKEGIHSNFTVKMKPSVLNFAPMPSAKKIVKPMKIASMPPIKTKLNKLVKRPAMMMDGMDGQPPMKKKRGRPKKNWGDMANMGILPGAQLPGTPVPLAAAQLANIGKSLMINNEPVLKLNKMSYRGGGGEPPLKMMKIRKEHMEIQDMARLQQEASQTMLTTTKTPTVSPNKSLIPPGMAPLSNAELLKRLPPTPGLIPDRMPPAPVRLPKELAASISITPSRAHPSPQKETPSSSRGFAGDLPPNVCSSVTITRINMGNSQKLPSPYDDSITPGIGPPPGLEGPIKRPKMKGVPPPPPLQIPIQAETESGITITPIVMGGNSGGGVIVTSNKEHRYDHPNHPHPHPLPPPPPLQERPPPLQERPPQKASMLAKLDEELSSTPPSTSSSSSKEQRRKEKEKRKELKKEKKKKAKDKDKSKDKSEKKKKKKDKSGESSFSSGEMVERDGPPLPAKVPRITLKLGGHSNTPTPVDSPNPPPVYHEPTPPGPPPLKKLNIKSLPVEEPKPPKQPKVVQEEDPEIPRFTPLVTRPQKPARAAKANAAAGIAAVAMGANVSHQEIVQFPSRDSRGMDSKRGRGRPPKGGVPPTPPVPPTTPSSSSKQANKSSVTVLETETVGCIIDEHGNKIWICPACGRQDDGSPMIGCDSCDDWYHFACMGIEQAPGDEEEWFCPRCLRKQTGKHRKKK